MGYDEGIDDASAWWCHKQMTLMHQQYFMDGDRNPVRFLWTSKIKPWLTATIRYLDGEDMDEDLDDDMNDVNRGDAGNDNKTDAGTGRESVAVFVMSAEKRAHSSYVATKTLQS